jgi:hypothetical protein
LLLRLSAGKSFRLRFPLCGSAALREYKFSQANNLGWKAPKVDGERRLKTFPRASGIDLISPGIHRWSVYSPEHKVELASHSVFYNGALIVFDPVGVSGEALDWFPTNAPNAIILTNANHLRSTPEWTERFPCAVYGPAELRDQFPGLRSWADTSWPWPDWEVCPLPGGAPGETSLHLAAKKLAIFGDAVVNLPSRKLEILPDKYCSSPRSLRKTLQAFLKAHEVETALFAHGNPILTNAGLRILDILGGS